MSLVQRFPLSSYFALAFTMTWSILSPGVASTLGWVNFQFDGNLLFALSALGPLLAAFIVVGVTEGRAGAHKMLQSIFNWRVKLRWWFTTTFFIAGLFGVSVMLAGFVGKPTPSIGPVSAFLVMLFFLIVASFGEEVGWRGFALPLLQERQGPFKATLILTLFWWLWHLPVYWIMPFAKEAVQKDGFVTIFVAQFFICLALGVVCAWVYNGSRSSILMSVVMHASWNLWQVPFAGQEASVFTLPVFVVFAVVVVFVTKGKLGFQARSSRISPPS